MNGKIKLKLNRKSSIKGNRYEVFIDGHFIGSVDDRNPKIDHITNLGNHKILVKTEDFEKEYHFTLSSRKLILPIDINENYFWSKQSGQLSQLFKGIIIGFLLVYAVIITFLTLSKQIHFTYPLLIPFLLLILSFISLFSGKNQKFELHFK